MTLFRVGVLPGQPLAAAGRFHAEVLPGIIELLDPPRDGEVASRSDDGGGFPQAGRPAASPHHQPAAGPPPRPGEDFLTLVFPPADHTHRAWRLAAVQSLARAHTPVRVNAVASNDEPAIAAAAAYLAAAEGVTGQLLPLDGAGAGEVV